MKRSWTDQPEMLERCNVLGSFRTDRGRVEVRVGHGYHFVTAGTLFGSQTVECEDAAVALVVILALGKGGVIEGIEGARLLDTEAA